MSVEENKAIVRWFYEEYYNNGDMSVVDELIGADYVGYLGNVARQRGREGRRQARAIMASAFPDQRYTIEYIIAEGDKVMVRWSHIGTHLGDFVSPDTGTIGPTGRQAAWTGINIYRVSGGMIVEEWREWDRLGAYRQLGAVPPTPGGS